jgi:hypothetical protein
MLGLARAERKASRFVKDNVDVDDIYEQLNTLRDYVTELTSSAGHGASRQFGRAATTRLMRRMTPRRP